MPRAVVEVQCRAERPGGQLHLGLELFGRLADPGRGEAHPVHLVRRFVHQQVDLAVLLVESGLPDPAHVGVLVDEALALAVDQDAVDQGARRRDRERDLARVHAAHRGTDGLGHADGAPVVALRAHLERAAHEGRAVLAQHVVVEDEAARGQHDTAARPHRHRLAEALRLHPHDALVLDDEAVDAGVGRDRRTRPGGRRRQVLHEQPAGRTLGLGQVPTWRRPGDLVERIRVLAARVDEALGAGRRHGRVGAERGVEGDSPRFEPVEVAEALRAVARRSWPRRDRARRPPSCSGTCRRGCPRSRTRSGSASPRPGRRCPRPAPPPRPGRRSARRRAPRPRPRPRRTRRPNRPRRSRRRSRPSSRPSS